MSSYDEKPILTALGQVLVPSTALLTKINAQITAGNNPPQFYVQQKYLMSQGSFPALHISAGPQQHTRNSTSTYEGLLTGIVEYYDRWDSQPSTIDAIRDSINTDLAVMWANVRNNENLTVGMTSYAVSIPKMTFSPYRGEIDDQFPGIKLVYRTMTLTINILPYD